MNDRLRIEIGTLPCRSPVLCGSGEHVMTLAGVRAALATGAGGVIAKSINESPAAASQIDRADYVQLDGHANPSGWRNGNLDGSLFCRSGLGGHEPGEWFRSLAAIDRDAADAGQFVAGSVVLGDPDAAIELAATANAAGLRVFELNMGAPHGPEAKPGAITIETDPTRLADIVTRARKAFDGHLWIKLTGLSGDLVPLAVAAHKAGADAVGLMGRFLGMVPDLDSLRPVLGTSAAYGGGWALPVTCRWLALARRAAGPQATLIGTNGARDGHDVARMMLAGASAVQMTSAVLQRGFVALSEAAAMLDAWLEQKGLAARDIVGLTADTLQSYADQPEQPGRWRKFVPPETIAG